MVWTANAIQVALDGGPWLEPMWISDHVMVDETEAIVAKAQHRPRRV